MYTPIPLMGARGLNAPGWKFRAELGDDLLDAHRDRCRDEWERRDWLGLTAYWTRTAALLQRLDRGHERIVDDGPQRRPRSARVSQWVTGRA